MKRAVAVLLVLTTVFALFGCGKGQDGNGHTSPSGETATVQPDSQEVDDGSDDSAGSVSGETNGQTLLADFKARMEGGEPTLEALANEIIGNEIIPFGGATAEVEPGFLNGFTEEIDGFEEGWTFGPMIGTIPFVGYVFRLGDGADVDGFIEDLKDKADLRWNICTAADEMVCDAVDNTVFFVMCQAQFEE